MFDVLLLGGGGREHALAWALAHSPLVSSLITAPGNPGTQGLLLASGDRATNMALDLKDLGAIDALVERERIDFVVVGPEAPLVAGVADRLEARGVGVFGPSAAAARLEGSKAFAKAFMARHGVPTARHASFTEAAPAKAYLDTMTAPFVLKADGLASGKGVVIAETRATAEAEIDAMLAGKHGDASATLVIEEFLHGEEASVFVITDGERAVYLPPCQDHKRAFDGDNGPNTGGMGAYAPAPVADADVLGRVHREIVQPTLAGMAAEGAPYRGVLYVGLMIDDGAPRVVEFNCRFGDPETQALMPLLVGAEVDLFDMMLGAAGSVKLLDTLPHVPGAAATVVLANRGYPGRLEAGDDRIKGLDFARALTGVDVFIAGARLDDEGRLRAAGGRVLNVVGQAASLHEAVERAYAGVAAIAWPGGFHRRDIGARAMLDDERAFDAGSAR